MKENRSPVSRQIDGNPIDFVAISREFTSSKYGDKLKSNVRFLTFKPEQTTHGQWEKLLGADVNNLHHLKLSYEITKRFLDNCSNPDSSWQGRVPKEAVFSPREQSLLQLTAIVHDWGEAIIGDIPLPQKTSADEEREMVALKGLIHEVLGDKNSKEFCERIGNEVTDVLSNPSTKLGRAFNAIEYVGYSRTSLRAWEKSKTAEEPAKSNLEKMACEVVPHGLPKLRAYSELYPPVDAFLNYHQGRINEILERKGAGDTIIWRADSSSK